MAGGLKKEVEKEVVATPSTKQETVAPVAQAVEQTAPVAGFHSRDFGKK